MQNIFVTQHRYFTTVSIGPQNNYFCRLHIFVWATKYICLTPMEEGVPLVYNNVSKCVCFSVSLTPFLFLWVLNWHKSILQFGQIHLSFWINIYLDIWTKYKQSQKQLFSQAKLSFSLSPGKGSQRNSKAEQFYKDNVWTENFK